jgi:hypothetical protein
LTTLLWVQNDSLESSFKNGLGPNQRFFLGDTPIEWTNG